MQIAGGRDEKRLPFALSAVKKQQRRREQKARKTRNESIFLQSVIGNPLCTYSRCFLHLRV